MPPPSPPKPSRPMSPPWSVLGDGMAVLDEPVAVLGDLRAAPVVRAHERDDRNRQRRRRDGQRQPPEDPAERPAVAIRHSAPPLTG